MAADNKLELVVEVDVNKANASIKSINSGLSSMERVATQAARGASAGIDGFTVSVAKGAAAGALFAGALEKVVGWLKEAGVEIVKYAARTEALTVVTSQLAKVNGYQESAVARLVERIKALGISTQEAHSVVQRMIFAELDLAKATELARVAQDAAVISGVNSSEALENIILGITTGQTRLLHNMGLQVSLERTIQEEERRLGRAISETEKRQAMLNKVLSEGQKIFGTYERAMGTAGKQMTSLTRYWQEAKNALGSEFLPEMRKAIQGLTDLAKWTAENADAIAKWAKGIAAAALGAAIGKFITWVAGAKKAIDALTISLARNPLTAVAIAATVAGTALYEMYQDSLKLEEQLKEQTKAAQDAASILYHVDRGKTLDELQQMGYSIDQIKKAFLGAKEGADDFMASADKIHFESVIKVINTREAQEEAKRQAEELAREVAKKQREINRETLEDAIAAERALVTGPGRALLEFQEKARKATVFVDSKGVEHQISLTHQTIENLEREHRAKLLGIQRESVNDTIELYRQEAEERLKWDSEVYAARIKNDLDIAERNREHVQELLAFEQDRAGFERDAQLRAVEATNASTLEQKLWVEQRKAEIEIDYLERVHEIKMRLFDLETSHMVMEEEANLKRLGYRADEIHARIAELTAQRDEIRRFQQEAMDAAIQGARETAAIRQAQLIRDQNQRIFDSLKQQAGGVFDALLQKSQSVWSAIANSFKTALLTAIKEVVTSRVAAMLMYLFTGQKVTFAGGGAGTGGSGGILGGLGGLLGIGAMPVFGGTGGPIPGGAVGGWGTPPFIPSTGGAGGGGLTSKAGVGVLGGFKGWKDLLSNLGNVGYRPERWRLDEMGNLTKIADARGIGGWQGGALLAGGSILALEGLRRGGWSGVAMTTAGGAMIGAKFGGPLGAAIGAGVGFVAGLVRLFVKSAEEKAREKIKALYGVDIADKGLLKQIVDTAKQAFGGNLDMAIRSQQIRDLVQLYAMSTGQPTRGMPATVHPLGVAQVGGSLYQSPGYSNGTALPGLGGLPTLDRIGGGVASGAGLGTTVVNLQIDSKTVGNVIIQNGRVVAQGAINAMKANAGRRELTALQVSPGLVTA